MTKTYTSYSDIGEAIKNKIDFEGNSVTGKGTGYDYKVYSYSTLILWLRNGKPYFFDNTSYSPTTSKLQNIIIDVLGANVPRRRAKAGEPYSVRVGEFLTNSL